MSWRSWQQTQRKSLISESSGAGSLPAEHEDGSCLPSSVSDGGATVEADSVVDAAAFNALVERHAHEMLAVAAAIVGRADGEDAAQEAVVRAWQAWPTLRDRDAFASWLLRITVNVCRDWLRGRFGTRLRLTEPLGEQEGGAFVALLASDPGGSDHAAALDLRQAIAQLPAELRLIVALRYYAGLDATEIGHALEIPSATVRTRLRRALSLLRERLGGSAGAPEHPGKEERYGR